MNTKIDMSQYIDQNKKYYTLWCIDQNESYVYRRHREKQKANIFLCIDQNNSCAYR